MGTDKTDKFDEVLDEKLDFILSLDASASMDMIAYEYAVRSGIDPKTAAKVHSVEKQLEIGQS